MAGLCKPYAAEKLVKTLRQEIGLPIHFHTHDIGGAQAASVLKASEVGLDIADAACAGISSIMSQPSLNAIVEALRFTVRESGVNQDALLEINRYWEAVRQLYTPFETGLKAPSAEVYAYEMPGGQYTNLYQQAKALGLGGQWPEVCRMYAEVNMLFGDIVKVTPTSKVVGDMALFMVANNLTSADCLDTSRELAFPESVVELFEGRLGQPPGGFPPELQTRVLKGRKAFTERPGINLAPADILAARTKATEQLGRPASDRDALSSLIYPKVFADLASHQRQFSDTSVLPTAVFFHGPEIGVETPIEIETGKTLIVKLLTVGDAHPNEGTRTVFFELNGQPREVVVTDRALVGSVRETVKADAGDPAQIGSPLPGLVVSVGVQVGDAVRKGQKLLSIEAMKMETTIYAERAGRVTEVVTKVGHQVVTGELLLRIAPEA
jgi:pyruvate carboxylase